MKRRHADTNTAEIDRVFDALVSVRAGHLRIPLGSKRVLQPGKSSHTAQVATAVE